MIPGYPDAPAVIDGRQPRFLAFVVASLARRASNRNVAVMYGSGLTIDPHFSIEIMDLMIYQRYLGVAKGIDAISEDILELIFIKNSEAVKLIEHLRSDEGGDMDLEEKKRVIDQIYEIEQEILELTETMEKLGA